MNVEHKMAMAKASSNKGIVSLSSETAILFYKTTGNQHLECSVHFWLFQYQTYTDKLERIPKNSNEMATEKKIIEKELNEMANKGMIRYVHAGQCRMSYKKVGVNMQQACVVSLVHYRSALRENEIAGSL